MDKDDHMDYTVGKLVASEELLQSLVGKEVVWVHPSMSYLSTSGFKYGGEVVSIEEEDGTIFVDMGSAGTFYLSSGSISVR